VYIFIHYTHPSISESGRAIWQVSSGSFPVKKRKKKNRGEDEPLLFPSLGARPPATPLHYLDDLTTKTTTTDAAIIYSKRENNKVRKICRRFIVSSHRGATAYREPTATLFLFIFTLRLNRLFRECSRTLLTAGCTEQLKSMNLLMLRTGTATDDGLFRNRLKSHAISSSIQRHCHPNKISHSCSKFITLISVLHDTKPIIGNGGCRVRIDSPCNPSSFVASCKARK